jgi:hypothetical protein
LRAAEQAAADTLATIVDAQRTFRKTGGRGGFATDVNSLQRPCPGETAPVIAGALTATEHGYVLLLRAANGSTPVGTDCHGRPTASDFYAAVHPADVWAGRQALATTWWGRSYVFFDGVAPLESDMGGSGLAVPLDTLSTFKIP